MLLLLIRGGRGVYFAAAQFFRRERPIRLAVTDRCFDDIGKKSYQVVGQIAVISRYKELSECVFLSYAFSVGGEIVCKNALIKEKRGFLQNLRTLTAAVGLFEVSVPQFFQIHHIFYEKSISCYLITAPIFLIILAL